MALARAAKGTCYLVWSRETGSFRVTFVLTTDFTESPMCIAGERLIPHLGHIKRNLSVFMWVMSCV